MAPSVQENNQEPVSRNTISREQHEELLRRQLTPAGAAFARKLDKAVDYECATVNNNGSDAVKTAIDQHHLKSLGSVKTVNRLAASWQKPRVTCYYMIMNHAGILLSSGHYHRNLGELNPTGHQLLQIWRIYANKLIDRGEATHTQIDAEEQNLLKAIGKAGRPKLSLIGAIKSAFKK